MRLLAYLRTSQSAYIYLLWEILLCNPPLVKGK